MNCVLFRPTLAEEGEFDVCQKYFPMFTLRSKLPPGSIVVGRYSVLPYYSELAGDLAWRRSKLINSVQEHNYVADLGSYTEDLGDLTPKTYYRLEDVPDDGGPFVVKGATNSRKDRWKTHMFAADKREAIEVALRLQEDALFKDQDIYVRQYVPLETHLVGLNGLPVTTEFRLFFLDGQELSRGYYWSSHIDDLSEIPNPNQIPVNFLNKVRERIHGKVRFVVVDVAKTQSGDWIVVELNDGQMSGLSENDPDTLYRNLKTKLEKR